MAVLLEGPRETLEALAEAGDWDGFSVAFFRDVPRRFAGLTMPVLLQTGSESPREFYVTDALAAVLPAARRGVLAGQAHEGMTTAPDAYVDSLLTFANESKPRG